MKILSISGNPDVAEVAVGCFREDRQFAIEVVDGLAPPISREKKWIINVSCQFGCSVGCPFCDAGMDFRGNLTKDELLAQIFWALGRHPKIINKCEKLKIHFARMGEPALNNEVIDAMEALPKIIDNPNLWCCVATIAPQGAEDWFERLLDVKEKFFRARFQLQFSIQSTCERTRRWLIPIPHWGFDEIADYGEKFHRAGDRKVVLNFALAEDVEFSSEKIISSFDPRHFAVKMTPVNPTESGTKNGFKTILRSERDATIRDHTEKLLNNNFDVILSVGDVREDEIGSNCGQSVRKINNGIS